MTSKEDRKVAETIGHVRFQDGNYRVRCATCGKGVESPSNRETTIAGAKRSLRGIGWNNNIDGLWRCGLHSKGESE